MSNPNQSTAIEQSQEQIEQPQEGQGESDILEEPELFYNEETGDWYDSTGRVYRYDNQENVEGGGEDQGEQAFNVEEERYEHGERGDVEVFNMREQARNPAEELRDDGNEDNYYRGSQLNNEGDSKRNEQNYESNYDVKDWQQQQQNQNKVEPQQKKNEEEIKETKPRTDGDREPRSFALGQNFELERIKSVQQIKNQQENKKKEEQQRLKRMQEMEKQLKLLKEIDLLREKEKERDKQLELEKEKQRKREEQREKERKREKEREKERELERQLEKQRQKQRLRQIEMLRQSQKEEKERHQEQSLQEKQQYTAHGQDKVEEKKEKKQKKEKKSKKSKENKEVLKKQSVSEVSPVQKEKSLSSSNVSSPLMSSSEQPKASSQSAIMPVPVPLASVGQSQITEVQPIFIIKEAQKERIESTLKMFVEYTSKHRLHTINQKNVYINIAEEIDRKKGSKYVWYHFIKEYMTQYQALTRGFHETSYKIYKEEAVDNKNAYLNIGEELKVGTDELVFLRKETGNSYNRFNEYIGTKISLQLEVAFNKFINDLNKAQYELTEKKKKCLDLEEQFKKNVERLSKIYNRGRLGKQQEEDVFVQTCKFVQLEKEFRDSLIVWGKGVIELRKIYIAVDQRLADEVQVVLNLFKNAEASIYSFHPQKFETIISSKQQIEKETKYSKLAALADCDYIKYSLETIKNPVSQISDKNFSSFTEMPHFETIVGRSTDLLKGMINKSFQLKDSNEELINTISGNLVHFNRYTSEYKEKFIVKNLVANIVADGVIQFDQVLPGIIFNNNRTIRMNFKDQDRAEELICLLNEKI